MWTVLLSRVDDPPGVFFDRRALDPGDVRIGRSAAMCDIVLPDDQGFVSREHCLLSVRGLDLFVIDTSVNGVALNAPESRIAPRVPVAVHANDRLFVGSFVVTVATEASGAGYALVPPPPPPLPSTPRQRDDMDFGGPAFGASGFGEPAFGNQADSLWDGSGPGEMHDFLRGEIDDFLAPPASSRQMNLSPIDLQDPLARAFSRPILAEPQAIPEDFAIPEDWADMLRGLDGEPPSDAPPPASAPPPFYPDPQPQRAAAASQPAATATDAQSWAAFYEGAGLSAEELRIAPDAMRRLGVMYRQVVLGLSDILNDRAAFKDEFRVERTQISIGRNNPLKHLPPLDAAKVLLGEPLPGFMGFEDAVRTAFEDAKMHQLAMLAGVQRALVVVFERLSPAEIDKLIEKATTARKGFSFRRGVDRWSVYQTIFEALRRDATSNANGVMSVAFREGYEGYLKSGR